MDSRRKELGEFFQVARSRHAPETFGFPAGSRRRIAGLRREEWGHPAAGSPHAPETFGSPAGSRRRIAGLRREEVAQLAGISPTWYTWIEQGRPVNVSPAALGRLAQTLRLTRSERAYLFELAGRRDPLAAAAEDDAASELLMAVVNDMSID